MLQSGSDAASISGSVKYLLSALEQTAPQSGDMVTAVIESCVDVRDLAEILSKLLVLPEASGERFVIAARKLSSVNIAHSTPAYRDPIQTHSLGRWYLTP